MFHSLHTRAQYRITLLPFSSSMDVTKYVVLLTSPPFNRLIIVDELDYLITKDRAVLHDLFMLTTFPFSRCILIGSAPMILSDILLSSASSDSQFCVPCMHNCFCCHLCFCRDSQCHRPSRSFSTATSVIKL